MTPHLQDLALRCRENLDRGVDPEVGQDTFIEFVIEAINEMENILERFKAIKDSTGA